MITAHCAALVAAPHAEIAAPSDSQGTRRDHRCRVRRSAGTVRGAHAHASGDARAPYGAAGMARIGYSRFGGRSRTGGIAWHPCASAIPCVGGFGMWRDGCIAQSLRCRPFGRCGGSVAYSSCGHDSRRAHLWPLWGALQRRPTRSYSIMFLRGVVSLASVLDSALASAYERIRTCRP